LNFNKPKSEITPHFNKKSTSGAYQPKYQMKIPARVSTNTNFEKPITYSEIPNPISPRSRFN
jgi:hypothetical protein